MQVFGAGGQRDEIEIHRQVPLAVNHVDVTVASIPAALTQVDAPL